jgi:hypothetical protein
MLEVSFPSNTFRIREDKGKEYIFDGIRKRWVRLTPEEWVRQNVIQFLVLVQHIPAALISVEKEILLNGIKKRFDILIFDEDHQPKILVECKSMEVDLQSNVLEQVLRYHVSVPVPYLLLTNGSYTYGWEKKEHQFVPLKDWQFLSKELGETA